MGKLTLSTQIEEQDYDPLFIIDWKCFSHIPEIAAFFPNGLDPTSRAANLHALKFGVFGGPIERACAKISLHNNNIISFISCRVYRGSKGILSTPPSPPLKLPFVQNPQDRTFFEWYSDTYQDKVREMDAFQRPMVYVQVICTDPAWQRRGAGTMLMNWYIEFARREGIRRCILCASPLAAEIGFYERYGFRRVGVIELVDEVRWPGRVGTPEVVMVRDL